MFITKQNETVILSRIVVLFIFQCNINAGSLLWVSPFWIMRNRFHLRSEHLDRVLCVVLSSTKDRHHQRAITFKILKMNWCDFIPYANRDIKLFHYDVSLQFSISTERLICVSDDSIFWQMFPYGLWRDYYLSSDVANSVPAIGF